MRAVSRTVLATAVAGGSIAVLGTGVADAQTHGSRPGAHDRRSWPAQPFRSRGRWRGEPDGTVFVQQNGLTGNSIAVFTRSRDGALTPAGSYATGGLGGREIGAEADYLASQGSLVYDAQQRTLLAVNAGSDSVSVFSVAASHLSLREVLPSGGAFPSSIAVHGDLVYVLDAGGAGTVAGFRLLDGRLVPLPSSERSLGLAGAAVPGYLESPGQVGFSPDGSQLLVTTKAGSDAIDSFRVGGDGRLSQQPVVSSPSTPVPFSFTFSPSGRLVVTQAGESALGTYRLTPSGALTSIAAVPDGQAAMCWIAQAGGYYYVANAGSATISAYTVSPTGQPALVGSTGIVASTGPGAIDLAASADGSSLYVESGPTGAVDEYRVDAHGSLTPIGSVTGLGAGIEGIATAGA